jgi:hypothetical protein
MEVIDDAYWIFGSAIVLVLFAMRPINLKNIVETRAFNKAEISN